MPPLSEYPDSFGAHRGSVFSHPGPDSYVQLGSSEGQVTGGDVVEAVEAGLKFFDAVVAVGLSDSGAYWVTGCAPAANPSTNKVAAHARTWLLKWYQSSGVASPEQVSNDVDLSGETVRLVALGRY